MNKNLADTGNIKIIGSLKYLYRSSTCDEVIFSDEYQNSRFFVPNYNPREDHIILDIGAHIGVFSLQMAKKVKKGTVYAIEADNQNYQYLKSNIELNNLLNVKAYLLALTDYRGTGKLFTASASWSHSLCQSASEEWNEVATDTLTNFVVDNNIDHVDFMKVNVEGAEYSIVLSTTKSSMSKIKLMLIEFHPSKQYDEHDLRDHLEACGFLVRIKYDEMETRKGWIIAKFVS